MQQVLKTPSEREPAMTLISDIFDIPTQVHQGDFVLRLTEGVQRPAETLRTYVVTPQLAICFDQALQPDQECSGTQLQQRRLPARQLRQRQEPFHGRADAAAASAYPEARSIPELASVVTKHNAWTQRRQVPARALSHDRAPQPGIGDPRALCRLRAEAPSRGADARFLPGGTSVRRCPPLRAAMGDEMFFARLGRDQGER